MASVVARPLSELAYAASQDSLASDLDTLTYLHRAWSELLNAYHAHVMHTHALPLQAMQANLCCSTPVMNHGSAGRETAQLHAALNEWLLLNSRRAHFLVSS